MSSQVLWILPALPQVECDNECNNDGCSVKDGGRVGGAGNNVDLRSRIGSGGNVGGDVNSNSNRNRNRNSDSEVNYCGGDQNFGDNGCCEACDGSGSNGGSSGRGCGT